MRWGLGPVFRYEWLLTSRRWQLYAGRAVFLAGLLIALCVAWLWHLNRHPVQTIQDLARLGEAFFYALMGTQLALVLLAAPAYTAGAVCVDKARGTLLHLLVTDLSAAEVVLGKLGSRLLPVLGLVLAALPVLAFTVLLGGVDPLALAGGTFVTVGVVVLSCALALSLSVWGSRTHEVLLANYLLWAGFLLANPVAEYIDWRFFASGGVPDWLPKADPFWLVFAPYAEPGKTALLDYVVFLIVCLGLSIVLVGASALSLRRAAMRQGAQPRGRWHFGLSPAAWFWRRVGPRLDPNPVLWREWHRRRPTLWARAVWLVYALCAIAFTVVGTWEALFYPHRGEFPIFVNAFEAAVGMLLLSVTASTSLSEERVRGSLDMLLATPLATRSIIWGKWWATFRVVPLLALLPMPIAAVFALSGGALDSTKLLGVVLLFLLLLAYGAAITSLGLALATWIHRLGRAITVNVILYVLLAGAWPFVPLFVVGRTDNIGPGLSMVSPFWGTGYLTAWLDRPDSYTRGQIALWSILWVLLLAGASVVLFGATLSTFDRCLGRAGPGAQAVRRRPRLPAQQALSSALGERRVQG